MSIQRKAQGARRRLTDEVENMNTKIIRDGYGCVDFFPVTFPDGETEESLGSKQQQLKEMYKHESSQRSDTEITALMSATYILQRQDLAGSSPHSVR